METSAEILKRLMGKIDPKSGKTKEHLLFDLILDKSKQGDKKFTKMIVDLPNREYFYSAQIPNELKEEILSISKDGK